MIEVTAEMIERGRGADPRIVADRRRVALQVREAREKLTSASCGHRAYDLELLRLYAVRRKAALPGLIILSAALAFAALRWMPLPSLLGWLCCNLLCLLVSFGTADRFLAKSASAINLKRWERLFVFAETAQGAMWAVVVALTWHSRDPHAVALILIALLLIAAMNATATSSLPAAVYGGLTPMALATIAVLRPTSLAGETWLLALLALGALVYFVDLARKLRASTLQALSYQADKDDLIGELEQSRANSDLARRRAEESNLAKSRFLATMSHELRTPLNAILGFSEVMNAELFGKHAVPAYKEYAKDIHTSGEHLLMLINEILDLSRVEAGRYELREESVDLRTIIDECRHLVTLRATKKDIAIQQENGERLPRLWADERALRQVALNLLSNAIKFTPQGGLVRIKLGATIDGGQFFSIRDTGTGIPESEIPIVMSSFGRGTLAHKNAEEGTGLGLPIVKGLVELHGGTFELRSKIREGTEVIVTLPPERAMTILPRMEVETAEAPGKSASLVPARAAA